MANSQLRLGVAALASGLKVYLEGDQDLSGVMHAIRGNGALSVQWFRVGAADCLGEELVREARWSRPDVWLLAREAGAAVERVQLIRATEGTVPILVVSKGDGHTEANALDAGADGFCRWPEDAGVLANRIHALLRRASGSFRVVRGKALELLEETKQLRFEDQLVQLSPPEYQLLSRLDRERNRWVPNDELWNHLTSSGARPHDSSLLRMHLLRVRRKLGSRRWVLRTERGRGTMLTDLAP